MEKSNFLRGGEMNAPYASPQLELLEIATEQGFNLSDKYLYDNGGLSDGEWDESNY